MSISRVLPAVLALAAAASLSSCVVRARRVHEGTVVHTEPQAEVVVTEEPPPARVEVIPAAPSVNHVWVGGYWTREGSAWVWMPGVYVVRPVHRTHWEPGHWVVRGRNWVWVPGHWV